MVFGFGVGGSEGLGLDEIVHNSVAGCQASGIEGLGL